jgi:hypothetical protein
VTFTHEVVERKARIAFEAYCVSANGLNFQKTTIPPWPELPIAIRAHWCAAVTAVLEALQVEGLK